MNVTNLRTQAEKPAQTQPTGRPIPASELLGPGNLVVIEHLGARYELRLTRNGKLILTK